MQLGSSRLLRAFHRRAGVHDDIQTGSAGSLGGGFIDDPELEPHGFDAQPILLGDSVVDDRPDPLTVHEAVNDLNRAGDVSQPPISPLAQRVFSTQIDRTMLMPSRSRRYSPMRYAVRSVLADKPTTAHVAGVVNNRLITSGSRHVRTAQILADPAGVQPLGQRARSVGPSGIASERAVLRAWAA